MTYRLLLIDDEADVQYSFRRIFSSTPIELNTASSGEEGLKQVQQVKPDLVLMDVRMGAGMNGLETLRQLRQVDGRLPVIMMTAYGTTQTAIEAMKLGAYDYLLKPFDVPKLKTIVGEALRASRAMRQTVSYEPLMESEDYDLGIIGRSACMQEVFKLIGQTASTDATVLITGESGTGKELVARAIYTHGDRASQPFLAINCAAIPEQLLESELFGHEKGAFTGAAAQRVGKFEQCNGGTIFLDEIGDMSLATQTKILRVLQGGSFERVGGNQLVKVDVRVIAATNKPLEEAVAQKSFREDLFYRLNVMRIRLPALRQRTDDIRLLVDYFLQKFGRKSGGVTRGVHPEVLQILERHNWPGNVRELENVIQRALVVCKSDVVMESDLPPEIAAARPEHLPATSADLVTGLAVQGASDAKDIASLSAALFAWARSQPSAKVLPAVERELVICALEETKGNQVQAAKLLGITRATLRKRIEKFQIHRELSIR